MPFEYKSLKFNITKEIELRKKRQKKLNESVGHETKDDFEPFCFPQTFHSSKRLV